MQTKNIGRLAFHLRPLSVLAASLLLSGGALLQGCGGGNGGSISNPNPTTTPTTTGTPTTTTPPTQGTGIVTGRVVAPNGTTPISGATVSTSDGAAKIRLAATLSTTTDANGQFSLANIPPGLRTFTIVKGQFSKTFTLQVVANQTTNAPLSSTTLPVTGAGATKIAVVTGDFDSMEDVLAKLGYGTVSGSGSLQLGTQKFDLFDGNESLPSNYGESSVLFNSASRLATYDIVFINCGAEENSLNSPAVVNNLRAYVNGGGRLYVTDLAYDYVEQTFPAGIDFMGNSSTPANQPEGRDDAELGDGGITVNAAVTDTPLKNYLQARGALNGDGSVRIEGFAPGWGVINAVPSSSKSFVQGSVSFNAPFSPKFNQGAKRSSLSHRRPTQSIQTSAVGVKPLTVVFSSGQGRVLYSSYHTEDTPGTALAPQEQILAYLVFEL